MRKKSMCLALLLLLLLPLVACTEDSPGYMRVVDSDGNIILIDEDTGAITTISLSHHIVHEGAAFLSDTVDETLADSENITLVFRTMSTPETAHMFFEFTTLVGGHLRVWEDVTWTTGTGGLLPIVNRKRETTMTSSGFLEDLTATPVFTATDNILEGVGGLNTAGATQIHHIYAWGKKEKFPAGNVREAEGFILKPDTQYAVVFTAIGGANKAQIILNWFEHAAHD